MVVAVCTSRCKIEINKDDTHISYLPLAHVMERILFYTMIWYGAWVGMYGGDILKIKEDLAVLKPTIFASVPRLFNKMHDAIKKIFDEKNYCLKSVIRSGVKAKLHNLHS